MLLVHVQARGPRQMRRGGLDDVPGGDCGHAATSMNLTNGHNDSFARIIAGGGPPLIDCAFWIESRIDVKFLDQQGVTGSGSYGTR
ncbi:hypothetical protein Cs7R123_01710 [Catellatospora sp. TT07R-123]|nr:hypothetical protein Cs7R123_01710 [Catellatospora sp. TT07R-123]